MKEYRNEKGQLHKTNGPALIWNDGSKYWYINDKLHREDGPAIEYSVDIKLWYLNGINYTEDQYHQEVIKLKLKRLINL